MIAVADASFLIGFCLIEQWALLATLVERVYMAPSVWTEVVEQGQGRPGAGQLQQAVWVTRQAVRNRRAVDMQHAITEVQTRIRAIYPDATFRLVEGEDPPGFYLDAYTDAEDAFTVPDLVIVWLVDLSLNTGVHLHVIPLPYEAAAPRA
jgi:hypothetical protein